MDVPFGMDRAQATPGDGTAALEISGGAGKVAVEKLSAFKKFVYFQSF
jgi:hypothetical protein